MILHSYLRDTFLRLLSKSKAINVFPKHILKSKARDQSNQARQKLFCLVVVKIIWATFHESFDENWKHVEMQNQRKAPQLTLLWYDYQEQPPEVLYKKAILKDFARSTRIPHLCGSLFFKILQTFRPSTLLKRDSNTSVSQETVNIAEFLIQPILKNICKRLLFNFFQWFTLTWT